MGVSRKKAERRDELVLTDARAMRALAHPVRQRLLDLLESSTPMTATEAAKQVGISPSAMSYHLRALEKWGIVERVDSTDDGRERPWRLAARSIKIEPAGTTAKSARRAFMTTFVDRIIAALERADTMAGAHGFVSGSTPLLTSEEAAAVYEAVGAALAPYEGRTRGGEDTPADAHPHNVFFIAVPEPDASESGPTA